MKLRFFRHTPYRPRRETPSARRLFARFTLTGDEGRLFRRILVGAGAALLLLILFLLGRVEPNAMSTAEIQTLQARGVLKVGVREDMPGMGKDGGGLEYALGDALARRILPDIPAGNSVRYVEVTAMNVDAKLAEGQIDAALSMMPVNAKSAQYVYSRPYYEDPCYFITASDTERLVLQNVSAGCVQNTPGAALLDSYIEGKAFAGITKLSYASYPDMIEAVMRKRVDVALMPELYIRRYLNETALNPASLIPYKLYKFRVSGISPGSVSYAVACPADMPALATLSDLMIKEMIEDGSLRALYEEYGLTPRPSIFGGD